jgi:RNA polymerase sigma factor (sigma-70 family)
VLSHQLSLARSPSANAATGDAALVQRARGGDVGAFEALYVAHAGRVYALALRLTADALAARELTQDVFVRAWESLPEFRGDAAFTTWLHRIAVNAHLMQRRGDKRRAARVALASDEDDLADVSAQSVARSEDVGAAIDLERAVAKLPPGVRRAFVLHDVEGYSHEEIARMTGLAAGTLRAQLHRARQLLMEVLRP